MQYRDLVPDRLGGAIIARHIRIPDGGPVPDMVHYHTIGFQLIWCYRGWVDLVYEDCGPPFRLEAGGCVIQPPEIRHRVLHASPEIEVVEIGVPAIHVTTIDHAMELPNGPAVPDREWQGQRFVHARADAATWQAAPRTGWVQRGTGIAEATNGVADVRVLRRDGTAEEAVQGTAEIHFTFVLEGALDIQIDGARHRAEAADAFVLPPDTPVTYRDVAEGTELLEVVLPA